MSRQRWLARLWWCHRRQQESPPPHPFPRLPESRAGSAGSEGAVAGSPVASSRFPPQGSANTPTRANSQTACATDLRGRQSEAHHHHSTLVRYTSQYMCSVKRQRASRREKTVGRKRRGRTFSVSRDPRLSRHPRHAIDRGVSRLTPPPRGCYRVRAFTTQQRVRHAGRLPRRPINTRRTRAWKREEPCRCRRRAQQA